MCSPRAAIIYGIIAREEIKRTRENGAGLATLAIVLGAIGIVLYVLGLALFAYGHAIAPADASVPS